MRSLLLLGHVAQDVAHDLSCGGAGGVLDGTPGSVLGTGAFALLARDGV